MKILLAVIALLTAQAFIVTAQDASKKTSDEKNGTVVPVIRQSGSLRFRCLSKEGVFNNQYELETQSQKSAECVNPADLLGVEFGKHTLIGYQVRGDCFVRGRAEVFRDDEAKTYRVRVSKRSGGCRAAGQFQGWIVIGKIPAGYKVEFSETKRDDGKELKTELIEENLSLTEDSQKLETRPYEMDRCIQTFRQDSTVISTQKEFLEKIRNDFSRKNCLKKLEKIDFEKETLLGITLYSGYCEYPLGLAHRVMRDDRQKRYVVFITYDDPYGSTCRALGMYDLWLAVPKPPANYEIKFEVASVFNQRW